MCIKTGLEMLIFIMLLTFSKNKKKNNIKTDFNFISKWKVHLTMIEFIDGLAFKIFFQKISQNYLFLFFIF